MIDHEHVNPSELVLMIPDTSTGSHAEQPKSGPTANRPGSAYYSNPLKTQREHTFEEGCRSTGKTTQTTTPTWTKASCQCSLRNPRSYDPKGPQKELCLPHLRRWHVLASKTCEIPQAARIDETRLGMKEIRVQYPDVRLAVSIEYVFFGSVQDYHEAGDLMLKSTCRLQPGNSPIIFAQTMNKKRNQFPASASKGSPKTYIVLQYGIRHILRLAKDITKQVSRSVHQRQKAAYADECILI